MLLFGWKQKQQLNAEFCHKGRKKIRRATTEGKTYKNSEWIHMAVVQFDYSNNTQIKHTALQRTDLDNYDHISKEGLISVNIRNLK